MENKKGNFANQVISYLVKNPSRFIASMLVGNNVALVIYGLFMPLVLSPYLPINNEYVLLLVQTILSTILILIVAEFLPKAIFNTHSNRLLEFFALPSSLFYFLFYPIVSLMVGISNFMMKYVFRADIDQEQQPFDKVDLDNYIKERTQKSQDEEEEEEPEIQIFRNALEFNERKAREFMVPRTEMIAIGMDEGIDVLKDKFMESKLSKILIYKESIDDIVGYTHSYELFSKPKDIKSILRPVSFIPESMFANEVLNLLTKGKSSIAIVLDEFGGTSGLVTVEDVVEELFGEIDDEHDEGDLIEEKISDTEYLFSARQEVGYLNEKYNLKLPESDNYSTIGGLIINHLESIPEKGEELQLTSYTFRVLEVSNSKIEEVSLNISDD